MQWVEVIKTSPSGKTLFICRICGRETPIPGPCPLPPKLPEWHEYRGLTCSVIEQALAAKERSHPLVISAIIRSRVLVHEVQGTSEQEAIQKIRRDRQAVIDLAGNTVKRALERLPVQNYFADVERFKKNTVGYLWRALDVNRQELGNK